MSTCGGGTGCRCGIALMPAQVCCMWRLGKGAIGAHARQGSPRGQHGRGGGGGSNPYRPPPPPLLQSARASLDPRESLSLAPFPSPPVRRLGLGALAGDVSHVRGRGWEAAASRGPRWPLACLSSAEAVSRRLGLSGFRRRLRLHLMHTLDPSSYAAYTRAHLVTVNVLRVRRRLRELASQRGEADARLNEALAQTKARHATPRASHWVLEPPDRPVVGGPLSGCRSAQRC